MEVESALDLAVRRWHRFHIDVPVAVRLTNHGEQASVYRGSFRDISQEGLAIFLAIPLRIGSELELEFPPAVGHEPMKVSAVVRNRRENHVYGLEFMPRTTSEERTQTRLTNALSAIGIPKTGTVEERRHSFFLTSSEGDDAIGHKCREFFAKAVKEKYRRDDE